MTTSIEERISAIEARNQRVERDKAWETSWQRRVSLFVLTYLVMCLFMYGIGIDAFYLQAIIPTLGFLLSTLSLEWLRRHFITSVDK